MIKFPRQLPECPVITLVREAIARADKYGIQGARERSLFVQDYLIENAGTTNGDTSNFIRKAALVLQQITDGPFK